MGENNTAGLDPIFFFHHCFIDYVFWQWQKRNGATKWFEIDENDAGAKYGANNPPPAYADNASAITMKTPLKPFTLPDGGDVTSGDCIDIEGQMGYTFGPGSLDTVKVKEEQPGILKSARPHRGKIAHVDEIDRQKVPGSMLIAIYGEVDGERRLLDVEPVLSRWNVQGCANCMSKLNVSSDTPLPESVDPASLAVELHTRAGLVGDGPSEQSAGLLNKAMLNEEFEPPRYKLTVH